MGADEVRYHRCRNIVFLSFKLKNENVYIVLETTDVSNKEGILTHF
ncbi:hypothetical protein KJ656_05920 [bacterium]|nr:hypothetical protein [bacterium]